jgi:hypothetical protein
VAIECETFLRAARAESIILNFGSRFEAPRSRRSFSGCGVSQEAGGYLRRVPVSKYADSGIDATPRTRQGISSLHPYCSRAVSGAPVRWPCRRSLLVTIFVFRPHPHVHRPEGFGPIANRAVVWGECFCIPNADLYRAYAERVNSRLLASRPLPINALQNERRLINRVLNRRDLRRTRS